MGTRRAKRSENKAISCSSANGTGVEIIRTSSASFPLVIPGFSALRKSGDSSLCGRTKNRTSRNGKGRLMNLTWRSPRPAALFSEKYGTALSPSDSPMCVNGSEHFRSNYGCAVPAALWSVFCQFCRLSEKESGQPAPLQTFHIRLFVSEAFSKLIRTVGIGFALGAQLIYGSIQLFLAGALGLQLTQLFIIAFHEQTSLPARLHFVTSG